MLTAGEGVAASGNAVWEGRQDPVAHTVLARQFGRVGIAVGERQPLAAVGHPPVKQGGATAGEEGAGAPAVRQLDGIEAVDEAGARLETGGGGMAPRGVHYSGRRAAAARASSVIAAQSPAVTRSAGVSQEPPTQATLGRARKAGALAGSMPPVGQKRTCGKGPERAFSIPRPPAWAAGKSFMAV